MLGAQGEKREAHLALYSALKSACKGVDVNSHLLFTQSPYPASALGVVE